MTRAIPNPLQHTREWFLARRGKLTSSRMKTIVHGGPKAWTTLIAKLQAERATDQILEPDLAHVPAIAHGRKYEPIARVEAELALNTDFELVGFHTHPLYDYIGCSSDALGWARTVNVEIKCPFNIDKHTAVYQTGQMPDEHRAQVQTQMFVHDCDQTLFVSYHPAAAHWKLRTIIVEVPANRTYRSLLIERCEHFMQAMDGNAPVVKRAIHIPELF